MKKTLTLLAFLLFATSIWAQVPQKMSYQAVIRNNTDALVVNTAVGIKISVLQGSSSASTVYSETHTVSTNSNGLVSLQIGSGSILSGTFAAINWANGPYFIKTETDPTGGNNYTLSGTTELLSVPYALVSGQSYPAPGNAIGDIQYWNGVAWIILPIGTNGQVLKVNNNVPQWTTTTPSQGTLSTVTTDGISEIKAQSVKITGTVTNDGGEFAFIRGVTVSTSPNPTVNNGAIISGNGLGTFSASPTELIPNTTYYVRAFATTLAGTSYGNVLSFITTNGIVVLSTTLATNSTPCSTISGGNIISDGGSTIFTKGVCYGTNPNPTIADNQSIANNSENPFSATLTTSQPNTVYYYRTFCESSTGVFYGNELSYTTQNHTATVITNSATNIKSCTATLGMSYTPSMPNSVESFGVCYGTMALPTIENIALYGYALNVSMTTDISCLLQNTTYYARSFIKNCNGVKYGNQITFTTLNNSVTVTTNNASTILPCSFQVPVNIINYGLSDSSCYIGAGIFLSTFPNPDENNSLYPYPTATNDAYYSFDNLTPNTVYYIRGYADLCNDIRIYGNPVQVETLPRYNSITTNQVTDITSGTAQLNSVSVGNGANLFHTGFCYSTSPNPTVANSVIFGGEGTGQIINNIKLQALTAGTTYYVRPYGHNDGDCAGGIFYGDEISFTTTSSPLAVGQVYEGGIIIWLNGNGTSGIVAAMTDQGLAPWGCPGINIPGTLNTVGSGQANTNAILSGCTSAGIAAKICDDLILNGKNDWYLPSQAELTLIGNLNYFLPTNNYLTSTQYTIDRVITINGTIPGQQLKSNPVRVRAVRNF